jgi:hypothetical protein
MAHVRRFDGFGQAEGELAEIVGGHDRLMVAWPLAGCNLRQSKCGNQEVRKRLRTYRDRF